MALVTPNTTVQSASSEADFFINPMKSKIATKYAERLIKKTPPKPTLLASIESNPIKTFTAASTLLGLLFIYAFHLHIDYFPVFDLKSAASIIFSATYVGFVLLILCAALVFVPAVVIGPHLIDEKVVSARDLIFAIGTYLLITISSFSLLVALITLPIDPERGPLNFVLLLFGVLLGYFLYKRVFIFDDAEGFKNRISIWAESHSETLFFGANAFILSLLQFIPLLAFLLIMEGSPKLSNIDANSLEFLSIVLTASGVIQFISAYLIVAWRFKKFPKPHRLYSLVLALSAPLILTLSTYNGAYFPARVAYTTKIGNFYATEVALTKEGCDVLNSANSKLCVPQDGSYKACGAYVLSRLGSETFLQFPTGSTISGRQIVSVYLHTKDVLGLSVDDSKKFYNKENGTKFLKSSRAGCQVPNTGRKNLGPYV